MKLTIINLCLNCGKETKNKKFCSTKCYCTYCRKNNIGYWSFEVRSKAGKIGGKIGGKKSAEIHKKNKTGFFGLSHEQCQENGKKGGKISWKKVDEICKNKKIGIYGISKIDRIKNGRKGAKASNIVNKKNKTGFYGMSKETRRIIGKKGAKASNIVNKKNKTSICYDYKLRERYPVPMKDTSIEVKIQNFLKLLNIDFFTHKYIREIEHKYQCDIFIPIQNRIIKKTIIECDGDYWHGNSIKYPIPNKMQMEHIERDKIRTQELKEKGYRIIRLWGSKINKMNLNEFKEILKDGL